MPLAVLVQRHHGGGLELDAGVLQVGAHLALRGLLGDEGVGAAHAAGGLLGRDQQQLARHVGDGGVDGGDLAGDAVPGETGLQHLEDEGRRLEGVDPGVGRHLGHHIGVAAITGAHVQAHRRAGQQVRQVRGFGLVLGPLHVAAPGTEGVAEHAERRHDYIL